MFHFQIISSSTSEQRLELALATGQKNFFISRGSLNVAKIPSGSEDGRLRSYLQQCKVVYQQQMNPRASTLTHPRRSKRENRREDIHRSSSGSSSLESREAAKIASRTYEGIQQQKMSSGEMAAHRSSHESLPTKPQPHSSKRPLSDIYVSGASSFTDLSTTRSEHAEMVKKHLPRPITKHSSADNLEDPVFGRHHSMEPLSDTSSDIQLGSSWPVRSSGYDSDTNSESTSSTLLRSHSQGSISGEGGHGYIGVFGSRSFTRSIESVNTPTFDPPNRSNSLVFRRAPSYTRLDTGSSAGADELSSRVADLEERISQLSILFIFERHDMFKQIHAACEQCVVEIVSALSYGVNCFDIC